MLQKDKGPELGNSGPALRGRRWEGTHRLGCCLLNSEYQFRTLLSSIIFNYFCGCAAGAENAFQPRDGRPHEGVARIERENVP
jgi:hypothetical protein